MALSDGLVGYWSPWLGSSGYRLLDRTGRGNHGTLTNMDAGTDWVGATVQGRSGFSLDYDGINDYVVTTYKITKLPLTLLCFCNARTGGQYEGLLFQRGAAGATGFGFDSSGTKVGYHWQNSFFLFSGGPTFPLNKNVLIAATIESTRTTLYAIYDGAIFSGVNTQSHVETINGYDVNIARDPQGRYFDGVIHESGIWERALTLNELFNIYRLGPGWYRPYAKRSIGYAAAGFKPYWHRRETQLIGGGLK